jgi:hypothetical protein
MRANFSTTEVSALIVAGLALGGSSERLLGEELLVTEREGNPRY